MIGDGIPKTVLQVFEIQVQYILSWFHDNINDSSQKMVLLGDFNTGFHF